jgi:hypothetical protein
MLLRSAIWPCNFTPPPPTSLSLLQCDRIPTSSLSLLGLFVSARLSHVARAFVENVNELYFAKGKAPEIDASKWKVEKKKEKKKNLPHFISSPLTYTS